MLRVVLVFLVLGLVVGDVYLHGTTRGSNNRNCRNDNNDRRRNGNRLFDSQNNDKGGYSCPRAYPFPAGDGSTATVDRYGNIIAPNNAIRTDVYTIYGGSWLQLEWTNQHGAGPNPNLHAQAIWQYMTDDVNDGNEVLRDGTPTKNNDGNNVVDEATTTISENDLEDGRYGYHETYDSYVACETTERNKGLFIADQNLNGQSAKYTRQNPNGNRYGFECPEERDYYPYWRPSAWHDIAIFDKDVARCEERIAPESQNVKEKCWCTIPNQSTNNRAPNNKAACDQAPGGQWQCQAAWNTQKKCGFAGKSWACDQQPVCLEGRFSRDNHLGNQMEDVESFESIDDESVNAANFRWLVPEFLEPKKVVLRIRYNISTDDFDKDTTDSRFNGDNSPVIDRDNREEESYLDVGLTPPGGNSNIYKLGLAVNTNQYARTFEDRTYVFIVRPLPEEYRDCRGKMINLGMRGKRGNIVQVYPSVEYDFIPQKMEVAEDDCIHFQWTGSDYNPNRNPNNGEGGPPNPNNQNEAKADRTNLVQFLDSGFNQPMHVASQITEDNCFFRNEDGDCDIDMYRRMAFLDQDMSTCLTVEELKNAGVNGRQQRERDVRNCGKLSAARTPHFDGGIMRVKAKQGEYKFFSTRNNNFSNRSQKLQIKVGSGGSESLSDGEVAGVVIGSVLGAAFVAFAGVTLYSWHVRRNGGTPARINMPRPGQPALVSKFMPGTKSKAATAKPAV